MIKKYLQLIIIILLISCQSNNETNYVEDMKNCLSSEDVEFLNEATLIFENKLSEYYNDKDSNQNFYQYLTDISSFKTERNFTAKFYLDKDAVDIIDKMKNAGTFKKIWTKYEKPEYEEEIPIIVSPEYENQNNEEDDIIIYVLDSNGQYLNCLNKITVNEKILEVLNSQSKYGDISSSIIAGAMKNQMEKSDLKSGLNKNIIAINFYYNIVNLLNENPN